MSKRYYCANCGLKLEVTPKAIPNKGIVVNLIEPHICEETSFSDLDEDVPIYPGKIEAVPVSKKLDFNIPFVSKLNKGAYETESVGLTDKRKKEHLRDELVISTAPLSILGGAGKLSGKFTPAYDLEEPEERS